MPLGGFKLNGLGKQLVAPVPEIFVAATATSTTENITVPSTVVAGDGLVILEMSNRTYGDFADGWTMPRSDYQNLLRASIIRKVAVSGDANTVVNIPQGDATFIELIMLVIRRNTPTTTLGNSSLAGTGGIDSVSRTVFPGAPSITFARYVSINANTGRTSANSNFTEYSSSTRNIVRTFPYFTGADTSSFNVTMTASGACLIQVGQLLLS
jgi:hypothetical protein